MNRGLACQKKKSMQEKHKGVKVESGHENKYSATEMGILSWNHKENLQL